MITISVETINPVRPKIPVVKIKIILVNVLAIPNSKLGVAKVPTAATEKYNTVSGAKSPISIATCPISTAAIKPKAVAKDDMNSGHSH